MSRRPHLERRLLEPEQFLRSINLRFDAERPERIAHFYPTSKTIPLLRALSAEEEERAFLIVAPYGTGKSITASYALQLIENRPEAGETLTRIQKRLSVVSPQLGRFSGTRRRKGKRGLVIALHGPLSSLAQAIKAAALEAMERQKLGRQARPIRELPAATIDEAIALLSRVNEKLSVAGYDRVAILWDEFGRHLESLVAEGRTQDLSDVQLLAEFVSRSQQVPMTLGLLLHQDLVHYASSAPQAVRIEWKKIEGRFKMLQYVDDSAEVHRLIGEIVSSRRRVTPPSGRKLAALAAAVRHHGLFAGTSKEELKELLARTFPLEPVALHLLPRLSARVAQHERTLFNLLFSTQLREPIGPDALFDFFSADMQSDTAVGGTYRQWLETQSALSKVEDEDEARALKATCLLSLGMSGERARAHRDLVLLAVRGYRPPDGEQRILDRLLASKLLLHRAHTDELTVWHGTDQDLRGRLEEEKRRSKEHFQLLDFLGREVPPPALRPLEHNDEFRVRRYLRGEYHDLGSLKSFLASERVVRLPPGSDGKILYVVPNDAREIDEARQAVQTKMHANRLLAVVPREPLALFDTALEVWCLRRMENDTELVGSDPLVLPELQQMADDARGHLVRLLDRLLLPAPTGPMWFYRAEEQRVHGPRHLQDCLSGIMRETFNLTPRINNELIVRNRPSAPVVNGRKRLLLGILERSGREDLGIAGNRPDASMLRTVLLQTGLYRSVGRRWGYAAPEELTDPGLRAVWTQIRDFLTVPAGAAKEFLGFFETLRMPPYGVRDGLVPILLTAGLRAFPGARSLLRKGEYVADLLPSDIEELCKSPEDFRLRVFQLKSSELSYLRGLCLLFNADDSEASDLIRQTSDALQLWKASIPSGSLPARLVSEEARSVHSALNLRSDPVDLLLRRFPGAVGIPTSQPRKLLSALEAVKAELEEVESAYASRAAVIVRKHLGFSEGDNQSVREVALAWGECFPGRFVSTLATGIPKGVLTRVRIPYSSDRKLLDSLSSLLVGKPLSRWDDSTVFNFDRKLQTAVRTIEEAALSSEATIDTGAGQEGLAVLIRGRIGDLFDRLVQLVGHQQAETIVQTALKSGGVHGEHSGSARESVG